MSSCELQNFQEEFLLVARVFIGFLQMYVELSAALKILENFLFPFNHYSLVVMCLLKFSALSFM